MSQQGQKSYPLRPELIESTYWLYKATRNPRYLDAGRDMLASLQYAARCTCGYCHISDVELHQQEDNMESFFLAETVKYLWLLFDLAAGADNLVENGPYKYIFSTEGHLLPASPQISLVSEHCSYLGAYCRSGNLSRETIYSSDSITNDHRDKNHSESFTETDAKSLFSRSGLQKSAVSGLLKGFCPGLTHGQRYGISYVSSGDDPPNESSSTTNPPEKSSSSTQVVVVHNPAHISNDSPPSDSNEGHDYPQEPEDQRSPQLQTGTPQIVNQTD